MNDADRNAAPPAAPTGPTAGAPQRGVPSSNPSTPFTPLPPAVQPADKLAGALPDWDLVPAVPVMRRVK